jgi:uncharacterized protein (DUF849 family)
LGANLLGLLYGDGVRTGLEDNLWYDNERTLPASNRSLVERIRRLANELGRPLADRTQLRPRLGLASICAAAKN